VEEGTSPSRYRAKPLRSSSLRDAEIHPRVAEQNHAVYFAVCGRSTPDQKAELNIHRDSPRPGVPDVPTASLASSSFFFFFFFPPGGL
jgi:hypothetical protein